MRSLFSIARRAKAPICSDGSERPFPTDAEIQAVVEAHFATTAPEDGGARGFRRNDGSLGDFSKRLEIAFPFTDLKVRRAVIARTAKLTPFPDGFRSERADQKAFLKKSLRDGYGRAAPCPESLLQFSAALSNAKLHGNLYGAVGALLEGDVLPALGDRLIAAKCARDFLRLDHALDASLDARIENWIWAGAPDLLCGQLKALQLKLEVAGEVSDEAFCDPDLPRLLASAFAQTRCSMHCPPVREALLDALASTERAWTCYLNQFPGRTRLSYEGLDELRPFLLEAQGLRVERPAINERLYPLMRELQGTAAELKLFRDEADRLLQARPALDAHPRLTDPLGRRRIGIEAGQGEALTPEPRLS